MTLIVADTTSSLPLDLTAQLGIPVVPQIVIFGDQSFRDDTELTTADFLGRLRTVAVITPGRLHFESLSSDPDDTKYLACAVEGRADFIISGDHHLKDLKTFRGIRIVDPATFLAAME